jgi:hypothetical protein
MIPMRPRALASVVVVAAIAAATIGLSRPHALASHAVSLEWDANSEPWVTGYIVHVGTVSATYSETYDVGPATSFTYVHGTGGRRYYFAVSAYAGSSHGPRSEEVSAMVGEPEELPRPLVPVDANGFGGAHSGAMHMVTQACADAGPCASRQLLAATQGRITALAATADGRVLVVEDQRQIRVIAAGGLLPDPALVAESPSGQVIAVVVPPPVGRDRHVLVGRAEPRGDGSRVFSLVRYREVQNMLGEGATVVDGLTLWDAADPRVTVDRAGRIYVAMPGGGRARHDPYAGAVLHFNADGSVPRDSRTASPVLAHGHQRPTGLAIDGDDLWLAGDDRGVLARLALTAPSDTWPAGPWTMIRFQNRGDGADAAVRGLAIGRGGATGSPDAETRVVAVIDRMSRLHVERWTADAAVPTPETFVWPSGRTAVAVTVGPDGRIIVAIQDEDGGSTIEALVGAGRSVRR